MEDLQNVMALQRLVLSGNELKSIGRLQSDRFMQLRYLDISYNKLNVEQVLGQESQIGFFPSLLHLDLSGNNFSQLPSVVAPFPALRFLNLSHNQLKGNCLRPVSALPLLRQLIMYGNKIEKIPNFEGSLEFKWLEEIDLSNNNIKNLEDVQKIQQFQKLQKIILLNNPVQKLLNNKLKQDVNFINQTDALSLLNQYQDKNNLGKLLSEKMLIVEEENKTNFTPNLISEEASHESIMQAFNQIDQDINNWGKFLAPIIEDEDMYSDQNTALNDSIPSAPDTPYAQNAPICHDELLNEEDPTIRMALALGVKVEQLAINQKTMRTNSKKAVQALKQFLSTPISDSCILSSKSNNVLPRYCRPTIAVSKKQRKIRQNNNTQINFPQCKGQLQRKTQTIQQMLSSIKVKVRDLENRLQSELVPRINLLPLDLAENAENQCNLDDSSNIVVENYASNNNGDNSNVAEFVDSSQNELSFVNSDNDAVDVSSIA